MGESGAKVWYFPDGYLPEKVGGGPMEAHEALMLLNPNPTPAQPSTSRGPHAGAEPVYQAGALEMA